MSSNPQVLPEAISVADATAHLTVVAGRADYVFLADYYGFIGNPHIDYPASSGIDR